MELVGLNVLEVENVKIRRITSSGGVSREVPFAHVKVEGGVMDIAVCDGVEVPEGWSGRAVCAGQVISYTTVWQGQGRTKYAISPFRIEQFQKDKQVTSRDVLTAFFGQSPKPSASVDSKGSQQH